MVSPGLEGGAGMSGGVLGLEGGAGVSGGVLAAENRRRRSTVRRVERGVWAGREAEAQVGAVDQKTHVPLLTR